MNNVCTNIMRLHQKKLIPYGGVSRTLSCLVTLHTCFTLPLHQRMVCWLRVIVSAAHSVSRDVLIGQRTVVHELLRCL